MNYLERFLAKISFGPDCWLWLGATYSAPRLPYGLVWQNEGKTWRVAHRVMWELKRGAIPEGLQVLHRCDNPRCVNPAHLFLGSIRDNMLDRHAKRRDARGIRHGRAKLTEAQVREIRVRGTEGWKAHRLAPGYGVTPAVVFNILRGKTWRHVV